MCNMVDVLHDQLRDRFNACGDSQAFIRFSQDGAVLQTKEIRLGTVRWWHGSSGNLRHASDSPGALTELFREVRKSRFVDFFPFHIRYLFETLTRGGRFPHVTELMNFAWGDISMGQIRIC